jgi:hypothetical protein
MNIIKEYIEEQRKKAFKGHSGASRGCRPLLWVSRRIIL